MEKDRAFQSGHETRSERPAAGCAADWTIPQHWERFSAEEHRVWDLLFARQSEMLRGRAVSDSSTASTCCGCRGPAFPISRN
jgi:phenylalanine-4-hydroxylase